MYKDCIACKKHLYIKEFGLDRTRKDQHRDICKLCYNNRRNSKRSARKISTPFDFNKLSEEQKAEVKALWFRREESRLKRIQQGSVPIWLYQSYEDFLAGKIRQRVYKTKEENRERNRKYNKYKRIIDLNYRFKSLLGSRMRKACYAKNSSKSRKTTELLGCSIRFFRQYIQSRFKENMSWSNYGVHGWHIDHIKPCSTFDLTNVIEQHKCFHYTNLQPLWWYENLKKSDTFLQKRERTEQ